MPRTELMPHPTESSIACHAAEWLAGFDKTEGMERAAFRKPALPDLSPAVLHDTELLRLRAIFKHHFFLNTLNAILAEAPDHEGIGKLVHGASGYMRMLLRHRNDLWMPLGEEVESAQAFLALLKDLSRSDFDYTFHCDEAAKKIKVPGLFLQPLVENAYWHGSRPPGRPMLVKVKVQLTDGLLIIEVENPGTLEAQPAKTARSAREVRGVGLDMVRSIARHCFPSRSRFSLMEIEGRVIATIAIALK